MGRLAEDIFPTQNQMPLHSLRSDKMTFVVRADSFVFYHLHYGISEGLCTGGARHYDCLPWQDSGSNIVVVSNELSYGHHAALGHDYEIGCHRV